MFDTHRVVVLGGGDLATGVVARLHRAGFPVAVIELAEPLTVRRTVAVSTAVRERTATVEDIRAVRVDDPSQAWSVAASGVVPVLVEAQPASLGPRIVVDARMAKRNLGVSTDDADLVIGLGPGFTAGVDCHAVIETARGARLGRVIHVGPALPNTGRPGEVAGRSDDRVLRAPVTGEVHWTAAIGDVVSEQQVLGRVADTAILAPFPGVVRGLIADGITVPAGIKIGDVDPRPDTDCSLISDKALAVGGGVLEAVLRWISATS